MELKRLCLCLCVLLCHTVVALATRDTCPGDYRWYSMGFSCIQFSESNPQPFSMAQSDCQGDNADLVLLETDFDRNILQQYLEVLAEDSSDSLYWVGYQYNAAVTLVGVDGQSVAEVVTNASNYDESNGVVAADGVCIAIGGDGLFRRVDCTEPLRHICQLRYTVPQITSVSSDSDRFIADGVPVTLTCEFDGSNIDQAVWRLNGMELPENGMGISQSRVGSTLNLTINSFDQSVHSGSYDCLVGNPVGAVLSDVVLHEAMGGTPGGSVTINQLDVTYGTMGPFDNTEVRVIPLGVVASLLCVYDDPAATARWYQNGEEVTEGVISDTTTSSGLVIMSFQEGGIYQCRVTLDSGESATESIVLRTTEGIPNAIEVGFFFAIPESQQILFVSWLPPVVPNTHDRLLLRYQIFYSTGNFELDSATGSSVFLPSINSDDVGVGGAVEEGVEEELLGGLQMGTKYSLVVLASTLEGQGMEPESPVSATTYGSAPMEPVQNLTVERTADNTTVVAIWLPLETTLPEGPIARYEIQYRNALDEDGEATPNAVAVDSRFTLVVFLNLEDADEIEVRVRASVEINRRESPRFENTPWTEWIRAESVTTSVPSPPLVPTDPIVPTSTPTSATSEPVRPGGDGGDDGRAGIVAVAVVVPVLVVALVVAIVVAAVLWFNHSHKGKARLEFSHELEVPEDAKPTSP